ncbi:MAG: transcriptional regulator GcvA [Rhodobacteraceae bacterium]|nr:transcriptional regulator GcvA [Paracoccaceae bacterium]
MIFKNDGPFLPLRALQVFEMAARHQSFTEAGRNLGITQSAVSRKVSELEAILGVQLFLRSGPKLTLNRTGRKLADHISFSLSGLRRAMAEARPETDTGVVTLSMLPSVAAKWLAPRLGKFMNSHPQIDLRISASRGLVDLQTEGIDGAIRYGLGDWPGVEAVWLGSETVQPVCAPASIGEFNISTPPDLLKAPLLHADIAENWETWFRAAGLSVVNTPKGPELSDDTAILQAALAGQGIALGRSLLVADDLAAGRLVAPFDIKLEVSFSYWFVFPENVSGSLATVRDWVVREFGTETP